MMGGPVFMSGIDNLRLSDLDTKLIPLRDQRLSDLKQSWYQDPQKPVSHDQFLGQATAWFRSTKLNDLQGWDAFPCVDIIMGCTHFIESNASRHNWNIQILQREYAYYSVMGKKHTEPGNLTPGVPLLVSLPNYFYGGRPEWEQVLRECEQKDIDIHVDCAWATAAKGFQFDFDHPNIKSFAMSMSKYNLNWNRIGLRWSRQRSMDSCTFISNKRKYNELTTACGSFMMDNISRDYGWDQYGKLNQQICDKLGLEQTMFFYVVKDKDQKMYSIGKLLGSIKQ